MFSSFGKASWMLEKMTWDVFAISESPSVWIKDLVVGFGFREMLIFYGEVESIVFEIFAESDTEKV